MKANGQRADVTALSFHEYGVASSREQKIGSAVQCSGDEDGQKSAPRAGMDLRIMISWPLVLQIVLAALVQQYSRRLRSQIQSSVFTAFVLNRGGRLSVCF
jgi:hypothetical protein